MDRQLVGQATRQNAKRSCGRTDEWTSNGWITEQVGKQKSGGQGGKRAVKRMNGPTSERVSGRMNK